MNVGENWYTLLDLGHQYQIKGNEDNANFCYEKALQKAGETKDPKRTDTTICLLLLAKLFEQQGKLDWAENYLRDALQIYREVYGLESVTVAATLRRLSSICELKGEQLEASKLQEEADRILGLQLSTNCHHRPYISPNHFSH